MPQPTPEYIYVEKPTIDQLQSMGWQHIEGSWDDPQVTDHENFKQVLISDRLKAAIKRINLDDNGNPWLDDTQVNAAVSQLERLTSQRCQNNYQSNFWFLYRPVQHSSIPSRRRYLTCRLH